MPSQALWANQVELNVPNPKGSSRVGAPMTRRHKESPNAENNLSHVVWLLVRRQPDSFIAEARISKSLKIAGKQFGHAVAPDLVVKVFVVSNERNVHLQMVQSDDVEAVR